MKLLHLDSSILGPHSVSRGLSEAAVARLKECDPTLQITYRDLAAQPVPHLSGPYLAALRGGPAPTDPALQADLQLGQSLMAEFLDADVVVIGVALYNFTIASQLKAWVDRILVAGKTFKYGENGPVGLVGGKRLILTIARGGIYAAGTPYESFEHAEKYLRCAFAFIGISAPEVIVAEGVARTELKEKSVKGAMAEIAGIKV